MTGGEEGEERTPADVPGALKDCLSSGRRLAEAVGRGVIGRIRRIGPIRRMDSLTRAHAGAVFFESSLCAAKCFSAEAGGELGVAPIRAAVHARVRVGGAESGLEWRLGATSPENPAADASQPQPGTAVQEFGRSQP
jgi:hypothetical protein